MQLCTKRQPDGTTRAYVFVPDRGLIKTNSLIGVEHGIDVMSHIERNELSQLAAAVDHAPDNAFEPVAGDLDAPYRRPNKILGIGLNYHAHAADLGATSPRSSPASFLKGNHTIIGPGEEILVPPGIGRVTAEAELALVFGRTCYRVGVDEALDYVAGVTAVLDQTAEEILLENPRFLTRVKNYPTFYSFGPQFMTLDELYQRVGKLADLEISTIINGSVQRKNTVSNMIFSPAELVSFHSHVMPLYPGDMISTGTPGAVPISAGDKVQCRLGPLMVLTNPVAAG